jgi:hypothetical protein
LLRELRARDRRAPIAQDVVQIVYAVELIYRRVF